MHKIHFNDDNTRRGIEGWYAMEGDRLIVYVSATNSWEDWISDFVAFPWYDISYGCFVHLGLRKYAKWLDGFLYDKFSDTNISKVYLFGFSMGGGIAQMVGGEYRNTEVISIDGPRTTSKTTSDCTLYYNRGSLVNRIPFWFKRIKNAICLNDKWQPFWKSHGNYDIDKIIRETIG